MKISEAANCWGVSEKTVLNYILKGYIYNLSVEDNEIVFPAIPKPHIRRKPKDVKSQDQYILRAMNKEEYVNAKIMDIDQTKFEERMIALIKGGKIYKKDETKADYSSTLDFVLATSERNKLEINLPSSFELKVADQIGFVNGKML